MEVLTVENWLPCGEFLGTAQGVYTVTVSEGFAPLTEKVEEDASFVEGVHQCLTAYVIDTAGGGNHVSLRRHVGGDKNGRAGDNDGFFVTFFGG